MIRHMKNNHTRKEFQCKLCEYKTETEEVLGKHLADVHDLTNTIETKNKNEMNKFQTFCKVSSTFQKKIIFKYHYIIRGICDPPVDPRRLYGHQLTTSRHQLQ